MFLEEKAMTKFFFAGWMLLAVILLLPLSVPAYYKCIDEKGRLIFQDFPCASDQKEEVKKDIKSPPVTEREGIVPQEEKKRTPQGTPGAARDVEGSLQYDGRTITAVTKVQPRFRIRSEKTGDTVSVPVHYARGVFKISGLSPGRFEIEADIDANPGNPARYPGDFQGRKTFQVTEGKTGRVKMNLTRILHLTGPEDNGRPIPTWGARCRDKTSFGKKLKFIWEPLGEEGASYNYVITRSRCIPFSVGPIVRRGTTKGAAFSVSLPPSGENDFYLLQLTEHRNGKEVGTVVTHGRTGLSADYRFRVRSGY